MEERDAACGGCSRRAALGWITAAALAALVGVEVTGDGSVLLPVVEARDGSPASEPHRWPLPAADGVTIDRDTQVIVVRFQQHVYVFNLACPHENTALRWQTGAGQFECPRHHSRYKPDGTFIDGRATRNMDRFAIRREGNEVVADLALLYRSDQQPREWAAASVPA